MITFGLGIVVGLAISGYLRRTRKEDRYPNDSEQ